MYLRICENIAQTIAIVLVSMAYFVCLQQFTLDDLLALPSTSYSPATTVVERQPGPHKVAQSECRATASKSPARRIVLV